MVSLLNAAIELKLTGLTFEYLKQPNRLYIYFLNFDL